MGFVFFVIQEKEKEIEVHNIYSMRLMKPPHRLGSVNSVNSTPVSHRPVRHRKNSDPLMTPRHKAKFYEERRREEERQKREVTYIVMLFLL